MFLIETRKGVGQGLITIPVLAGKLLKIDIQYDSLDGIKWKIDPPTPLPPVQGFSC